MSNIPVSTTSKGAAAAQLLAVALVQALGASPHRKLELSSGQQRVVVELLDDHAVVFTYDHTGVLLQRNHVLTFDLKRTSKFVETDKIKLSHKG